MKEFLETIVTKLVDQTDKIDIAIVDGDGVDVVKLRVAKEEVGKVIGKRGHTAEAIRTLLNAVAAKRGKRMVLEILD